MTLPVNPAELAANGATVVINHRVHDGRVNDYEIWLSEIGPLCRASEGCLDLQIIRPIANLTTTYTVVIRFDTLEHLRQWMESQQRQQLIEKAAPLLAGEDSYSIRSGLDFWFTRAGQNVKVPVRWKQFLITWSAIYPLGLGVPLVLGPILRGLGAPDNRFFTALLGTATVVFLMVYVVMPRYTSLVQRWLFDLDRNSR
jgi:antibiotic biosynthesis monooxygenase (ABM) superfamily enzyme